MCAYVIKIAKSNDCRTNADTYSVNVLMPNAIGHPGGLTLYRLASIIEMSVFDLGHVSTTRLGSLWTLMIVQNVAGRGREGISFITSFGESGCSSFMMS